MVDPNYRNKGINKKKMKLVKFKIILPGINKHTLKFMIKQISAKSDF